MAGSCGQLVLHSRDIDFAGLVQPDARDATCWPSASAARDGCLSRGEQRRRGLPACFLPRTMSFFRLAARSLPRTGALLTPRTASTLPQFRGRIFQNALFSAQAGLSKGEISARVLDVLKGFEKVNPDKVPQSY